MKYSAMICVPFHEAAYIIKLLNTKPKNEHECFDEDKTITYSCKFENGFVADVKICGGEYKENACKTPLAKCVLFTPNGDEACCSKPRDNMFGLWKFEYNNNIYKVNIFASELSKSRLEEMLIKAIEHAINVSETYTHDIVRAIGITPEELDAIGYDEMNFSDLYRYIKE